jgi:hypothetical protein
LPGGSVVPINGQYMRVGNVVTASFTCNIDPTSAGMASSFEFTLPVATTISASQKITGIIASGESTTNAVGSVKGVAGNNTGKCSIIPGSATNDEYKIHFSYLVE